MQVQAQAHHSAKDSLQSITSTWRNKNGLQSITSTTRRAANPLQELLDHNLLTWSMPAFLPYYPLCADGDDLLSGLSRLEVYLADNWHDLSHCCLLGPVILEAARK